LQGADRQAWNQAAAEHLHSGFDGVMMVTFTHAFMT